MPADWLHRGCSNSRHHRDAKTSEVQKELVVSSLCSSSRIPICLQWPAFQQEPIMKPVPRKTSRMILAGAGASLLWSTCLLGGMRKPEWNNFCLRGMGGEGGFGCVPNSVLQPLNWTLHSLCLFFMVYFTLLPFIQRTFVEYLLCARYCWIKFPKTRICTCSLSIWKLQWFSLACLIKQPLFSLSFNPDPVFFLAYTMLSQDTLKML